ncbi:MAG: acyl-CoA dehydrogenase, partial [Gemmatimonadaceae bacterium]
MTHTAPQASASKTEVHLAAPDVNPSFTKGVFLGELREDLVFPFPEPSAEDREALEMILGSFRAFAADVVDARRHDHDGR